MSHDRGRHTAGIDGVKSLQPPQRLRLANELALDDTATPLRRIWIPKRGTPEKRPLGVPTLHERARQTVVPITVVDLTPDTIPYWELRARSSVATGIEDAFLTAYREGSFHYLLIVADYVGW